MKQSSARKMPHFDRTDVSAALAYVEGYWPKLERYHPHDQDTLVGLPRPYVVPSAGGGSFEFEELYYWDSYFMAQAFIGTSRHGLAKDMADDLLYLMDKFGIIPNGGRSYLTSRSQPPLLTTLILQLYKVSGDRVWLEKAMNTAKREYTKVWMGSAHPNWRQVFQGLSRFYDANMLHELAECESGWDMNPRFNRHCLDYVPVDLNALLYKYEKDFEYVALMMGDADEAKEWRKRARVRAANVKKFLWNDNKGCYFDYNYKLGEQGNVWSLAAFYPMWAGMMTRRDAAHLVSNLDKFEFTGGLTTTAAEPRISHGIPEQWAYPNGWAPLQMIVIEALERYGYKADAERIARKWLKTNLKSFKSTGVFYEKYNVARPGQPALEGVYPSQEGFGWTNSVFTTFAYRYLLPEELPVPVVAPQPVPARMQYAQRLRDRLRVPSFFPRPLF